MTQKEILEAEQWVTNTVTLYYEGMFWKAYERSAYLMCTQVRSFKTSRKSYRQTKDEIVSIGFPDSSLEKTMAGHACISQTQFSRTYAGFSAIMEQQFQIWKNGESPSVVPLVSTKQTTSPVPVQKKASVPYYELPVYKTARSLYSKMSTNKTLESIPKATKKRIVEPALNEMWDILASIFEVRELEKQLEEENARRGPEWVRKQQETAAALLLTARRKTSRCIAAVRIVYETKVHASDLGMLIPKSLYNDYSHDLVSVYKQLGYWAQKHMA